MQAIMDLYSTRKATIEILFDFLTDGPHTPEQNIIEPTVNRIIPWSIAYWKRGLNSQPLHGSRLDMEHTETIEVVVVYFILAKNHFVFLFNLEKDCSSTEYISSFTSTVERVQWSCVSDTR